MQTYNKILRKTKMDAWIHLLSVCFLSDICLASHFRGAMMFWKLSPNGQEIYIDYRESWRRTSQIPQCNKTSIALETNVTAEGSLTEYSTGFSVPFQYVCTDYSLTEDWQSGRGRTVFTHSVNKYYTFLFTGCCWISTLVTSKDSSYSWSVSMTINTTVRTDTGRINHSPSIEYTPITRLQHGCNHTIPLPVFDEDNDIIKCRWANGSQECAAICNSLPGAILNEDTCTVTYKADKSIGWYAVAIQLEDFNYKISPYALSSVPIQFIVSVENITNNCTVFQHEKPKFVGLTLPDKACVGVTNNTDFSTVITIKSGSSSEISELNTVSPIGLVKSALQQSNQTGNWHVNITWNPNRTDTVNNVFCFSAVDEHGLTSDQRCITLLAGVPPANIIASSRNPNSQIVSLTQRTWSIEFDQESQRPNRSAYIYLYLSNGTLLETINVYNSTGVNYTFGATTTWLQFSTNTILQPGQEYYFLFGQGLVQGKSYCGAESNGIQDTSFWRFSGCVDVRCYRGLAPIACQETFFNCTENWQFQSPCTRDNILAGHTKFPHPTSDNKFILCDASGKSYIAYCPPNQIFYSTCAQCAPSGQTFTSSCQTNDAAATNPCTKQNILAGNLFFPSPNSETKFIHCDIWGHPFENECQSGTQWDQLQLACVLS